MLKQHIIPLPTDTDFIRFFIFFTSKFLARVKYKTGQQSARFEYNQPLFCQICIIFTHLKLWVASARHLQVGENSN